MYLSILRMSLVLQKCETTEQNWKRLILYLNAPSHSSRALASCCDLLKSTISCELLRAEGLTMEMHYYNDGLASYLLVINDLLAIMYQCFTTLSDLSVDLVQTTSSCCSVVLWRLSARTKRLRNYLGASKLEPHCDPCDGETALVRVTWDL